MYWIKDLLFSAVGVVAFIRKNSVKILCFGDICFAIGAYFIGRQVMKGKDKSDILCTYIF